MSYDELVAMLVVMFQHNREVDDRKELISKVVKLGYSKDRFIDELDYLYAFALSLALENSYPEYGESLFYYFTSTLMQSFGYTDVNMNLNSRHDIYKLYWEENIAKILTEPFTARKLLTQVGSWAASFAYGEDSEVQDEITHMLSKKFQEYCKFWRDQFKQITGKDIKLWF